MEKYSRLTKDQSGAQIQDMLFAYAFCHNNGFTYMGACDKHHTRDRDNVRTFCVLKKTNPLCDLLCINHPIIDGNVYDDSNKIVTNYVNTDTRAVFTKEFRTMIYNNIKKNLKPINDSDKFIISVHIRRGDVQKDNRWWFRYVENDYYLKILTEILKLDKNFAVYVFSDGKEEDFVDFENLGCTLKINTDVYEAWEYFIQSDLLLLGNSSFSIVPGIFNMTGTVVYTKNKYFTPLDDWISDEDIDKKIEKIILSLSK